MLKAILFDVDGTIAETEEFHRRAFNAAFEELALPDRWSQEQYRRLLETTGGKERLRAYFKAAGRVVDETTIRRLHLAKNVFYARFLAQGEVQARPGVLRLFAAARARGLKLGIATTTSPENIGALLDPLLAGWRQKFDAVAAGDDVTAKKPSPDVYLACLERLEVDASEAVAIEDSQAGVRSARAAGLTVIATPGFYTAEDDFSEADAILPDLGELDIGDIERLNTETERC